MLFEQGSAQMTYVNSAPSCFVHVSDVPSQRFMLSYCHVLSSSNVGQATTAPLKGLSGQFCSMCRIHIWETFCEVLWIV